MDNSETLNLGPDPLASLNADQKIIAKTLQPYAYSELARIYQQGKSFAYYTDAETAYNILKNNEIWLRKTSVMNDIREIEYGFNLLREAVKKNKEGLKQILDTISLGLFASLIAEFDSWLPRTSTSTFIACLSEHNPDNAVLDEDKNGRLSMWRAYGRSSGIAFIMNNGPFLRPSLALKAYASPVSYLTEEEFDTRFSSWMTGLGQQIDLFKQLPPGAVQEALHHTFIYVVVCTKHPGFGEEKEWRVIHTPKFGEPTNLKLAVEPIGGVPQLVYKLPLQDKQSEGLYGVTVRDLIRKIIIGPTQHPFEIAAAMDEMLKAHGVSNPSERIVVSGIPMR